MSKYASIDPVLSGWAMKHSVHWYSEYQNAEVRTFFLKEPRKRDRVQVSVDVPQDGRTVVRVGQLRRGVSRLARTEGIPTAVEDLVPALDAALNIANKWAAEDDT